MVCACLNPGCLNFNIDRPLSSTIAVNKRSLVVHSSTIAIERRLQGFKGHGGVGEVPRGGVWSSVLPNFQRFPLSLHFQPFWPRFPSTCSLARRRLPPPQRLTGSPPGTCLPPRCHGQAKSRVQRIGRMAGPSEQGPLIEVLVTSASSDCCSPRCARCAIFKGCASLCILMLGGKVPEMHGP